MRAVLSRLVDDVWEASAPEELKIKRAMRRNSMTAEQVKARIEAQQRTAHPEKHPCVNLIVNDDVQPLLPQVLALCSDPIVSGAVSKIPLTQRCLVPAQ